MTLFFLLTVVVALPYLSALSYKNIRRLEQADPHFHLSKRSLYLQSVIMQSGICLIAFFTARSEQFDVKLLGSWTLLSVVTAIIFLTISLSFAAFAQKKDNGHESTLRHLLPENKTDRMFWVIAVIIASFCEEYIYRGVLYQVLYLQTGQSFMVASLLSAIVFGFGHGTQGEKAILQIIPFAIGFQVIAYMSGGLLLPMIVHFLYNTSVELFFSKKIRE